MTKIYRYLKVPGAEVTSDDAHRVISEWKLNLLGNKGWKLVTFTFFANSVAFAYFVTEVESNPEIIK